MIEEFFPVALQKTREFEDWCALLHEEVQPYAMDMIDELQKHLEKEEKLLQTNEGIKRDHWYLFGDATHIKSISSIRSKLARDLSEKNNTPVRLTEEQLKGKILEFSDLGRGRIVCTFNQDAESLLGRLIHDGLFLDKYTCPKGVRDFIYDPSRRDGLKGHRARQFSVRVPMKNPHTFGFEIQLMTVLQQAWDRRNHPFYEFTREGGNLSDELLVNDFACAETLHLVDRQADYNWREFLKESRNNEK